MNHNSADPIAKRIAAYTPTTLSAQRWKQLRKVVCELVQSTPPHNTEDAKSLLVATCNYLAWLDKNTSTTTTNMADALTETRIIAYTAELATSAAKKLSKTSSDASADSTETPTTSPHPTRAQQTQPHTPLNDAPPTPPKNSTHSSRSPTPKSPQQSHSPSPPAPSSPQPTHTPTATPAASGTPQGAQPEQQEYNSTHADSTQHGHTNNPNSPPQQHSSSDKASAPQTSTPSAEPCTHSPLNNSNSPAKPHPAQCDSDAALSVSRRRSRVRHTRSSKTANHIKPPLVTSPRQSSNWPPKHRDR